MIILSIPALILAAMVGLAAFSIHSGLRRAPQVVWWCIITGLLLLASLVSLQFAWSGTSWASNIIAGYTLFLATIVAIIAAVWMLWTLRGWSKLSAGVVGLIFPITLFASTVLGFELPREKATRCALLRTARALDNYHAAYGRYPDLLVELDPNLSDRPPPDCDIGGGSYWLYKKTSNQYYLGHWRYTELKVLGPRVCIYTSVTSELRCGVNNWGPFPPDSE